MKKNILFPIIIFTAFFSGQVIVSAHDAHNHHNSASESSSPDAGNPDVARHQTYPDIFGTDKSIQPSVAPGEIGITEKPGSIISANIEFLDENGKPLTLGDFIDRPTLILPVFYHCPKVCGVLLANLATALNDVTYTPGKSYRVLAFGFDDEETPEDAKDAKKNYLNLLNKDFPESEWRFLTGNRKNIYDLADAMGFKFKKLDSHNFVHPNILLCVGADRKIIRYIYGPDFLPFSISMAIAEAEKGTPGISIKKLVSYCFAYDPKGRRYVFKTFRVSGILIISLLAGFFFFLIRKKPSDKGKN